MKTWTNSIGMKFVYLPKGTFKMGDSRPALGASPVHIVGVSSFWIGQYEVTNEQFDQFKLRQRPTWARTNQQPATSVYYKDTVEFCKWLSKKDGRRYRLPTSAEWEYAARGGLEQKDYPWGNAPPDGRATWGSPKTTPVGSYAPNGFGLYDMAGNVGEWVSDWDGGDHLSDYYANSPELDPQGPKKGYGKITRGGSFEIWDLYTAMTISCPLDLTVAGNGFRIVMEAEEHNAPNDVFEE